MAIRIESAHFPDDAGAIHSLFSEYATSLNIDLTFQSFQKELASLPGPYSASQGGALLIARGYTPSQISGNRDSCRHLNAPEKAPAIGCVALRRSSQDWGEMKPLYVTPEARGVRLGDELVKGIVAQAKALGHRGIRLDTLSEMGAAQHLYRRHGFEEIEPYYDTPIKDTWFMGVVFTQM